MLHHLIRCGITLIIAVVVLAIFNQTCCLFLTKNKIKQIHQLPLRHTVGRLKATPPYSDMLTPLSARSASQRANPPINENAK